MAAILLVVMLCALAGLRGLDHDESQYVAAARLTAAGLLPYRDYAYLQTPLQPFVMAPLAWAAGDWALATLRLANALLAALTVAAAWRAMRAGGAGERTATICAGLLAACDVLLFAAGTARNDALPAALLALALIPLARASQARVGPGATALAGALLAAAAAAKLSYALPAAACGLWALLHRHRLPPVALAAGALPLAAFVAACLWAAPEGFAFGVLRFPSEAPAEWYVATGRGWRLALPARVLDAAKFLALGPAVVALAALAAARGRGGGPLPWMVVAGLVAAVLPAPVWRQYLLPALPPLFVWLALQWPRLTPGWHRAAAAFAVVGMIPSGVALTKGGGLARGLNETAALAGSGAAGKVATLSPQLLPGALMPDPRFAAGPFYFRSTGLLDEAAERRLRLVSRARLGALDAAPPDYILVGGEGDWTAGDARLDGVLEDWARARGWRRVSIASGRLRLYARPAMRAS